MSLNKAPSETSVYSSDYLYSIKMTSNGNRCRERLLKSWAISYELRLKSLTSFNLAKQKLKGDIVLSKYIREVNTREGGEIKDNVGTSSWA